MLTRSIDWLWRKSKQPTVRPAPPLAGFSVQVVLVCTNVQTYRNILAIFVSAKHKIFVSWNCVLPVLIVHIFWVPISLLIYGSKVLWEEIFLNTCYMGDSYVPCMKREACHHINSLERSSLAGESVVHVISIEGCFRVVSTFLLRSFIKVDLQ